MIFYNFNPNLVIVGKKSIKSLSTLLFLFLVFTAPSFGGPTIKATASVSIRNSKFVVVRVLEKPSEIDALISCFRRSKKLAVSSTRHTFSHKIDVEDRWLYDASRGELMLLSKAKQPIFQLTDLDKRFVGELIENNETNKLRQP